MFKLPGLPSPRAEVHELADFAELLAWKRGTVSNREILAYLSRVGENDDSDGAENEDDRNADELDEVMIEIDRRAKACGRGYPFELEMQGTVLKYLPDDDSSGAVLYKYLLLSTRLNMKSSRVHAEIDGTALLEEVTADVLRSYLGGPGRAKGLVFGTAIGGTFREKIDGLCRELGEGGGFSNIDGDDEPVDANDDKLDAVAWVPFVDGQPGQVVVFAQCKTGSSWDEQITQLQPDAFLKRWTRERCFVVEPVRAFVVSESARRTKWKGTSLSAGVLFERCRIVDCGAQVAGELLLRLGTWSSAALTTVNVG
jgi:hypothetical protein